MSLLHSIKGFARKFVNKQSGWSGDYASWEEAAKQCGGYSSPAILQKVTESILKVKKGEAVYERDSVIFDQIEYSWPLVAALLHISAQYNNSLKLLDFGGSLGSSYFQNRTYLAPLRQLQWNIVEQPDFVEAGRRHVQDEVLHFYTSMEECIAESGKPQLLLLACVLPYIQEPYHLLDSITALNIPYLMIDNTYFNYEERDRVTIQKVPPSIYDASYPCWFLSYAKILKAVSKHYTIVSEHTNDSVISLDGHPVQYKGFLAKRN